MGRVIAHPRPHRLCVSRAGGFGEWRQNSLPPCRGGDFFSIQTRGFFAPDVYFMPPEILLIDIYKALYNLSKFGELAINFAYEKILSDLIFSMNKVTDVSKTNMAKTNMAKTNIPALKLKSAGAELDADDAGGLDSDEGDSDFDICDACDGFEGNLGSNFEGADGGGERGRDGAGV